MSRITQRTRKVFALLSAGLVVGVGASLTLASWTDTEWVFGGLDGDANVGTSAFEVQQSTIAPFGAGTWVDRESNPGGELVFTTGALALAPGESVYAPVALRTTADSLGGSVTLNAAVAAAGIIVNDTDGLLWAALQQRVVTDTAPFTCDATAFGSRTPFAVGALGTAAATTAQTQALAAASGSTQFYCVEVTLPSGSPDTLQGRTVAPAWAFVSVSS